MTKETKPVREMRQIMDIEDHMEIVYTAFCIQCAKQRDDNTELGNFAEKLHKEGWRVSDTGDMLCPDCAKKLKIK